MKRTGNIIVSLLLSVMIIYLGGGVSFVHCACSDTTHLTGMISFSGEGGNCLPAADDCQPMKSGCMTITQFKMSPVNAATAFSFDFSVFQPLIAVFETVPSHWLPAPREAQALYMPDVPHSPPRSYLSLIRVLLI